MASKPRVLLRKLREVMAGTGSAQTRLDAITDVIADGMLAEVCSVYVLHVGKELELYATKGLRKTAVHETRLKIGEGLIGDVAEAARPLNLADAQSHPKFVYRPETGEEAYHSFLGVPILRGGETSGVLAVQNISRRLYNEEEVEVLQTTAMVLAELVNSGELVGSRELQEREAARRSPLQIDAIVLAEGLAQGQVVLHEPRVQVDWGEAEDIEFERKRLDAGIAELRKSIDSILVSPDLGLSGEHRDVLEAYRMFAHDEGWEIRLNEALETGLTAEAAVERTRLDNRNRMAAIKDAYLRERLHDLDDLANRLLRHLAGQTDTAASESLPDDTILVARNMGPADLLDYDRTKLRAVVLEEGSPSAHVTIVARALGVPVLGRVNGLLGLVDPGEQVLVDSEHGRLYLRAADDILISFSERLAVRQRRAAEFEAIRGQPAVTRDGVRITLNMNAGLEVDLPLLEQSGADGIGLFRTELEFMVRSRLPRVNAQVEFYRAVREAAGDKPVVFRTLDVGGDKTLPYMTGEKEENPSLGWRSLRVSLARPGLMQYQLRALLTAASGHELRVMFPLVAEISEFQAARELLDREAARLRKRGVELPKKIYVGTMLEVPALFWQLTALLPQIDFLSIGSNDLMQYMFAADRSNPRLSERYDFLSPGMLSFVKAVVEKCDAHGVPVSLCGEIAGRPLEAMALIGLGLRSISISPSAIGQVKTMVNSLSVAPLADSLGQLLDLPDHSLRERLQSFAADNNVIV